MSKHPFLDINMQLQKYKIIIIHSEILCITWVIPKRAHFTVEDKEIQSFKMISRHKHQKWMSWILVPRTVCFSGWTAFIESSQYSHPWVHPKWLECLCPHLCTLCIWFSCPLRAGVQRRKPLCISHPRKGSICFSFFFFPVLLQDVEAGPALGSCSVVELYPTPIPAVLVSACTPAHTNFLGKVFQRLGLSTVSVYSPLCFLGGQWL